MKKLILTLGTMLSLMISCQDNAIISEPLKEEFLEVNGLTGIQKDIMVNVLSSKFGGYRKGRPATRAMNSITMTPYVEDGDTLLFIVQYGEGWEVYSASKAANMVLLSSDKGQFNWDDESFPPALKTILLENAQGIKQLKETEPTDVHTSWGAPSLKAEDYENGNITLHKNGKSRSIRYPDTPSGTWVLIESEEISRETNQSPKLISTDWNQEYPWNLYSKKVETNFGLKRAPAGCVPIALSQYFYHTHYLNNIPSTTITTAIPTSDGKDFLFSGNSSEVWNKMAKDNNSISGANESAIFIGHVGRLVKADYKESGTGATAENAIALLNKTYGINFSSVAFDYSYIKNSIDQNYPIVASTRSNKTSNGTPRNIVGHFFIVDQYQETTRTTKYIYGLIRDPWPDGVEDPYASNDVDENGNIIGWAYTNEIIRKENMSQKISMNWGYSNKYDTYLYGPYDDWVVSGTVYNLDHRMYKREDIK